MVVVAGTFTAAFSWSAGLLVPLVVVIAAAGFFFGRHGRDRVGLVAPGLIALAAFAAYALPIVASGEATFAGYIRLDDTATWMAFIDLHLRGRASFPNRIHTRCISSLTLSVHSVRTLVWPRTEERGNRRLRRMIRTLRWSIHFVRPEMLIGQTSRWLPAGMV